MSSTGTEKHNMRIPDELWNPVAEKCARLSEAGYVGRAKMAGSTRARNAVSNTDVTLWAFEAFLAEADEATIARLGLTKKEQVG